MSTENAAVAAEARPALPVRVARRGVFSIVNEAVRHPTRDRRHLLERFAVIGVERALKLVYARATENITMRRLISLLPLISLVPLVAVVGCLDLDREVPDGFPSLKYGDGAHGVWEHAGKEQDVVARVGIIDVDGPGVLIKGEEDHPSLLLKFLDGLEEGEFQSPGDTPMVIATTEDETLFGDNFPNSSTTLVVEFADDELFAGTVEGTVCTFDEAASAEVCEPIEGKWTAIDDRDRQD